jgi:DNA helicase-2/ATP-dependent DNA helicase PcrA
MEICQVSLLVFSIFSISSDLRDKLPNVGFDAPDITPIKYDPLNVFYSIARLVFSEEGKNSARRKHIASGILTILSDEYQIDIPNNVDGRDVLKCLNSAPRIAFDGIQTLKDACFILMRYLHIDFRSESSLKKAYDDFFAKTADRIQRYKLSIDIQTFERCFKEKTGVVINTCTGVKGEEYTTVIAFGLLNGYLPHWDIIINCDPHFRKCEASKLLYVVCSRAKQNLFLFSEQGHCTNSGNPYTPTDEILALNFIYDS